MLKEYIQNLQDENDRKIFGFEQEMQELVTDLSCAEHMMEELQREKKLDTTIFSPRAIKRNADEKLNEKQEEIRKLKQRMEYVSQLIEEALKKRDEYRVLEEELYQETSENKEKSEEIILKNEITSKYEENSFHENASEYEENSFHENASENEDNVLNEYNSDDEEIVLNKEKIENDEKNINENHLENADTINDSMVSSDTEKTENDDHVSEDGTIDEKINKEELLTLLKTVYHKTETSIAFLNGNKNRCRAELKNCLKLIKDYAQKIEND